MQLRLKKKDHCHMQRKKRQGLNITVDSEEVRRLFFRMLHQGKNFNHECHDDKL